MCIIAYLILGMIAGWFVASQGVGNSGASDFRAPPPPMFRPPYYNQPHPQRSPCPRARRYIPRSVSPEIVEPVRGPSRVDRRSRDRTVSAPPLNRPGIVPPVRQRIAASMARHMPVGAELEAEPLTGRALDHSGEPGSRERRAAPADQDEARWPALAPPPRNPQLIVRNGCVIGAPFVARRGAMVIGSFHVGWPEVVFLRQETDIRSTPT
jgi:hypothetical protein